jgi:N utilization substance protein B
MAISRNTIREIVLQIVYATKIRENDGDINEMRDNIFDKYELTGENKSFIQRYLDGITESYLETGGILEKIATKQDLDAVSVIDRCILSLSLFEITHAYDLDIPPAVSVNEAVNLAKRFGKDSSASFINAVLRNYLNIPK